MSKGKHLDRVLDGSSDANIRFDDLCQLLESLGFVRRIRGGHQIFRRAGIADLINLQRDGTNAKPYQVRQVRGVILRYKLGEASE